MSTHRTTRLRRRAAAPTVLAALVAVAAIAPLGAWALSGPAAPRHARAVAEHSARKGSRADRARRARVARRVAARAARARRAAAARSASATAAANAARARAARASAARARAAQAAVPPGTRITLNRGWNLRIGPALLSNGARAAGTGVSRPATVPGVFDTRPLIRLYDGTVGTYVLRFRPPAAPPRQGWVLHFERVRRVAKVYLNGRLLGVNRDAFAPFELPTTGLRPNAINTLRVVVDNRRPLVGRMDPWWNWGGIDRPVWLQARGPAHVERLSVRPFLTGGKWRVEVSGSLVGDPHAPRSATVQAIITAPDGTTSIADIEEPSGAGLRTPFAFPVELRGNPDLWSPAHPALYQVQILVIDGGRVVDRTGVRTGLRTFAVVNGKLTLNGAPLVLHGAGITEDLPGMGDALTPAGMDEIVSELKALGANVTRAHYPLDGRLLDRFDASGILVWNEAPVIHADDDLATAAGRRAALAVLRRSILATRNHPSVMLNAVANELSTFASTIPGDRSFLTQAAALARGIDPGRLVALDVLAYPNYPAQPIFRIFDVLGVNAYWGWYPGRHDNPLPGVSKLAAFLLQTHARYPRQALVASEFGAEAFHHGSPFTKGTYEFQARFAKAVLKTVAQSPVMSGAIYWTLRDFAIRPEWIGGPLEPPTPLNQYFHKGLITYDGRVKPAFGVVKSIFAGER